MTERIRCKNPNCANMILVSTAQRTNGLCMPCVQAAARREREEYVRKHRRDVNEFEGITDPVEVLKIIHHPRKRDPLINWIPHPIPADQLYTKLNRWDLDLLATYAEGLIGTGRNDEAEDIVRCLAAFTDAPVENCLRAFIRNGSYWPSLAFFRASPDIRDELIARVERDDANRNHILMALAWIGDATVVKLFERWRQHPPPWQDLHIPPHRYSYEAGWELTDNGHRRDLYYRQCTKLQQGRSAFPNSFKAITERQDHCPWCSQRLTNLVNVAPTEFGISGGYHAGDMISVTTCEICTVFTPVFSVFNEKGGSHWHPSNSRPKYLAEDPANWNWLPQDALTPVGIRPPLFAADQFLPTTFSQLGGHPTWVQDAEYPHCPSCANTMMFLAQINCDDIEDHSEGIYYAFVCTACKMTATHYQQT
ncbi:MAG TPA: DUF1963 domain-containing protein [Candidatus Paceibacterota bacterium]